MQEVKNYGSFLQAFSLKKTIEAIGHECDFINIVPGKQIKECKRSLFDKVLLLARRVWGWDFVSRLLIIYKFQTRFSKEFLPYLGVKRSDTGKHHDIVVIGSDEVFNCTQKTWFGFSPQLFGEGIDADKIITYAASFGATSIEKLQKYGLMEDVSRMLLGIHQISVRDENSKNVVKTLTGRDPLMHVDPVLIYDYDEYVPQERHKCDYMIVYTYPGRISNKEEISAIKGVAEENGLRIISIGHYFPWCDEVIVPTPFEVLAWFRDATYVITDTFHGTVFSIKYNKKFCTIVRDMNKNKISCLLKQFGLEDRRVVHVQDLSNIVETEIDYSPINKRILEERNRTIAYLRSNLCTKGV